MRQQPETGVPPLSEYDLDQLEFGLRSLPGVISVGFEIDDRGLVVDVLAMRDPTTDDLEQQIRRLTRTKLRETSPIELRWVEHS